MTRQQVEMVLSELNSDRAGGKQGEREENHKEAGNSVLVSV